MREQHSIRLNRRRLMGMAGGAAAMAGFGIGPMASSVGTVVAQDGEPELHTAWPYQDLSGGGSLHAFASNGIMTTPNIYGDLMYVPMAMQRWADNSWLPLLATEWAFTRSGGGGIASPVAEIGGIDQEADQFTVTLRDDVVWSDGQPCTAQDVLDTFWCLRLLSDTVWQYVDDITVDDDTHVTFHMARPSTVVERYVIRRSTRPSSIYGEWAQQARDLFLGGKTLEDPEGRQLVEQFVSFQPETLVVNGPYVIDIPSISNARLDMVRNESSAFADVAAFDRIINFNGETDSISAAVLNKDIDYATQGFPPATDLAMTDAGIRVLRPPRYSGASVLFNMAALPEFADARARQAIAHIIDRDRNGFISFGDSGPGVTVMIGASANFVEQWIEPDVAAQLNPYTLDHDRATTLLEDAGWTRDGSNWKKPDGSDATYDLIFAAEYYSGTGIDVAEQLTSFGITVNPLAVTFTQVPIDVDTGNFQLAIRDWGTSGHPHPHYSFAASFFNHNLWAATRGGQGMAFPLNQTTEVAGDVDIEQLVVASGEGLDIDAQKESVSLLAQVFNELLPIVPLFELLGNNAALEGVRVAAWPADDDPILKNSPYADGIPTMLIYQGLLEPFQG